MIDWKKIVGSVAPVLATALGGPLAGVATKAVAAAVLGKPEAKESDIAAALAGATPEQLAALKKADQDFAVRMRELDIDLDRLAADDRDSARRREVDARDSWTPRLLALLVTAGFFSVLGWMLVHGKPVDGGDALLIMLGSLGTAWASVVAYYFGSSAGSQRKTDLLGVEKR